MAYTEQDLSTFVTNVIWQIDNAPNRAAAQLYASNAINGLDTLLQYGSIDLGQHTGAMLTIQGVLNDYAPPASAADTSDTAPQEPAPAPTGTTQPGVWTGSAEDVVARLTGQQSSATPWYKQPVVWVGLAAGGLVLGLLLPKVLR